MLQYASTEKGCPTFRLDKEETKTEMDPTRLEGRERSKVEEAIGIRARARVRVRVRLRVRVRIGVGVTVMLGFGLG
jgi:hypothetical protein